jgi:CRP-like cAMP-binding protein
MAKSKVIDVLYEVVKGSSLAALDSGAYGHEFVVRIFKDGKFVGFLARLTGSHDVRYFTSEAGARKAITREKRGEYHR